MADNVTITPGTGRTIRTVQIAGVDYQVVKPDIGGESAEILVTAATPMPTSDVNTVALGAQTTANSPAVNIASDQHTLPTSAETGTVFSGNVALTPANAKIALSATGTVVALVSSKKIRVLALAVIANAAVNVNLQSHTTTATATGLFYLAANGGFVLPFNPVGWFDTVAGEALDIALSGSIAVGGTLTYVAV